MRLGSNNDWKVMTVFPPLRPLFFHGAMEYFLGGQSVCVVVVVVICHLR